MPQSNGPVCPLFPKDKRRCDVPAYWERPGVADLAYPARHRRPAAEILRFKAGIGVSLQLHIRYGCVFRRSRPVVLVEVGHLV
jgi:hypothetical protein